MENTNNKYELNLNVEDFWNRLKQIANKQNVTQQQYCQDLNIPLQTFKNKHFRKTFPTLEELLKLSKYFSTTIEYLIFGQTSFPAESRINELILGYKHQFELCAKQQDQKIKELEEKLNNLRNI